MKKLAPNSTVVSMSPFGLLGMLPMEWNIKAMKENIDAGIAQQRRQMAAVSPWIGNNVMSTEGFLHAAQEQILMPMDDATKSLIDDAQKHINELRKTKWAMEIIELELNRIYESSFGNPRNHHRRQVKRHRKSK